MKRQKITSTKSLCEVVGQLSDISQWARKITVELFMKDECLTSILTLSQQSIIKSAHRNSKIKKGVYMMEFYDALTPKARKEHICECCGKTIKVGSKYSKEKGKYEGEFFDRKLCLVCFDMLLYLVSKSGDTEFSYDELHDLIRDDYCYSCGEYEECEKVPVNCEKVRENFAKKGVV